MRRSPFPDGRPRRFGLSAGSGHRRASRARPLRTFAQPASVALAPPASGPAGLSASFHSTVTRRHTLSHAGCTSPAAAAPACQLAVALVHQPAPAPPRHSIHSAHAPRPCAPACQLAAAFVRAGCAAPPRALLRAPRVPLCELLVRPLRVFASPRCSFARSTRRPGRRLAPPVTRRASSRRQPASCRADPRQPAPASSTRVPSAANPVAAFAPA